MLNQLVRQVRIAVSLLILLSVLTGLIYPLVVTGIAQVLFPWRANGSIIEKNGHPVGSLLIGQLFTDPGYFWGRPSATSPFPYNASSSCGSNLGPSNPILLSQIKNRIDHLKNYAQNTMNAIPIDLVTTSASGLDPDISPYAAYFQIDRISQTRHIEKNVLEALVQKQIERRTFGVLGEPRVNILQLNLALDDLVTQRSMHGNTTAKS